MPAASSLLIAISISTERHLADVIIEPLLTFTLLAAKLRDLVDAVAAGERPVRTTW